MAGACTAQPKLVTEKEELPLLTLEVWDGRSYGQDAFCQIRMPFSRRYQPTRPWLWSTLLTLGVWDGRSHRQEAFCQLRMSFSHRCQPNRPWLWSTLLALGVWDRRSHSQKAFLPNKNVISSSMPTISALVQAYTAPPLVWSGQPSSTLPSQAAEQKVGGEEKAGTELCSGGLISTLSSQAASRRLEARKGSDGAMVRSTRPHTLISGRAHFTSSVKGMRRDGQE